MGRKKQVTQMPQTIRGRKLGPRHRVDISKIRSVKQRRELEEFATRIQALVELQTDLKEPVTQPQPAKKPWHPPIIRSFALSDLTQGGWVPRATGPLVYSH